MRALYQPAVKQALVITPFAVMSVVTVLLAMYAWTRPRFIPAAYVTQPSRITPLPEEVCPGDGIRYEVQIEVRHAPAVVSIVESIWSIDRNQTVVFDDAPRWVAYTEPLSITRSFTQTIPALAPGAYELRSVAQEPGAAASGHAVLFRVKEGC